MNLPTFAVNTPLLLAQNGSEYGDVAAGGAALGVMLVFLLIGLAIGIAIAVAIAFLFWKPYSKVPAQHQTISPGLIWLMVIPLVNIVMMFIIAFKVPEAFKSYFDSVGDTSVGDAGKTIGMWWAICALCSFIPILGMIAGLASLVLLIIFLLKIWDMAKKIPDTAQPAMA